MDLAIGVGALFCLLQIVEEKVTFGQKPELP